ncbi:hypothetical protein AAT19DRAFT_8597 [Rhodotorula toruloides]|uniref:Uncharacterized protein n=1 Tax=Rhodotorula toruloides TaxID=5286 RepID=A0A2T0AHP9_RHOTO|nr:hypothetical protein AAT19DRAFT_8597 [Rhodotorula toruloides]
MRAGGCSLLSYTYLVAAHVSRIRAFFSGTSHCTATRRPTERYCRVWSTGLHSDTIIRTAELAFGLAQLFLAWLSVPAQSLSLHLSDTHVLREECPGGYFSRGGTGPACPSTPPSGYPASMLAQADAKRRLSFAAPAIHRNELWGETGSAFATRQSSFAPRSLPRNPRTS